MREVYTYYELVEETQQFVGHAMALHRDDSYLDQPAEMTIDAIKVRRKTGVEKTLTQRSFPIYHSLYSFHLPSSA